MYYTSHWRHVQKKAIGCTSVKGNEPQAICHLLFGRTCKSYFSFFILNPSKQARPIRIDVTGERKHRNADISIWYAFLLPLLLILRHYYRDVSKRMDQTVQEPTISTIKIYGKSNCSATERSSLLYASRGMWVACWWMLLPKIAYMIEYAMPGVDLDKPKVTSVMTSCSIV
jgi:hypothetical protein